MTSAAGTPGAVNGTANGNMITNIENGDFDYSNLADADNCLLDIELLEWTGKIQEAHVQLYWLVSAQSTASYFEVQRSANGVFFETIGEVPADRGQESYTLTDAFPLPLGYYRLKSVDEEGSIEYSRLLAFEWERNADAHWLLYPNPSTSTLTIEFSEALNQTAEWIVVDALGRLVRSGNWSVGEQLYNLDIHDLEAGYYILHIQTATQAFQRRWIKI